MLSTLSSGLTGVLAFVGGIGPWEVVIVLMVALLLFGGKKLPELARGMGRGLRNFKEELNGVKKQISEAGEGEDESAKSDPKSDTKKTD